MPGTLAAVKFSAVRLRGFPLRCRRREIHPSPASLVNPSTQSAIHRLLPQLYQLRDLTDLPKIMLEIASAVIPNVFATYNRLDLRSQTVTAAYHPPEWQPRMEAIMPEMHPHVHTHPIYRHVFETGDGSAHFTADFVSEEEWSQTPFARALKPLGVQECLIFCLQTSRQELIFIALNREGRTFTEEDREVAEVLRPHYIAAYENALAFTEVQALALLSAHAIEQSPHGIVLIDSAGSVLHMSPHASELLDRFFPAPDTWKTALPPTLLEWLARKPIAPGLPAEMLQVELGGSMLTVRAASPGPKSRLLHLRESQPRMVSDHLRAFGLSPREAEVLQWVAEGKSNVEISTILTISPRTVEKHLQTIFGKLGVPGRVPAILLAKGL